MENMWSLRFHDGQFKIVLETMGSVLFIVTKNVKENLSSNNVRINLWILWKYSTHVSLFGKLDRKQPYRFLTINIQTPVKFSIIFNPIKFTIPARNKHGKRTFRRSMNITTRIIKFETKDVTNKSCEMATSDAAPWLGDFDAWIGNVHCRSLRVFVVS